MSLYNKLTNAINMLEENRELKEYVTGLCTDSMYYNDQNVLHYHITPQLIEIAEKLVDDDHNEASFTWCIRACNSILNNIYTLESFVPVVLQQCDQ